MLTEPVFQIVDDPADEEAQIAEVAEVARLEEAAQQHTGAMVALYPDAATAAALAISGGESADDLHVTLAFLGKAAGQDLRACIAAVVYWASSAPPDFTGEISGVGHFENNPVVTYASLDLPGLEAARERLVQDLEDAGMKVAKNHGFTPHMTLDYARRRPKIDKPIPITFDRVTIRWAGESHSYPLGAPLSAANIAEALTVIEGKWDAKLHPRWPAGTPKAGQFIEVGDRFKSGDGKEWEVSHLFGGKIVANRVDGGFKNAATGVFNGEQEKASGNHVIKDAVGEGAPVAIQSGKAKGLESGVATIDPYVAPETHDASIPIPENSGLKPEEWQRFGKIDQEHYADLMERFGKYSPSKAKPLIDESYKDYESSVQQIVKNAYSAQYGSSSGFSLSLGSIFNVFKGGKDHLAKLDAQRKRALQLQGRHRDVIAWDLYNRCHAPDVTVFHKNTNGPSYWEPMMSGKKPIFSGLSQSWNFSANWGFGDNTLATPLAIRHVLMSSYSAQPIPGDTNFPSEYEISVPEQIKIDGKKSYYFQLFDITENQKKWLTGATKAPAGGQALEQFRASVEKGEYLPTPPSPPDIQMQGQSQKAWIDPPQEAAEFTQRFAKDLPEQRGTPYSPAELGSKFPAAFKGADGLPQATVAKQSELKPGDYMMGMKGTLYLIVEDPGDPEGFGLRYVKIAGGKFTGESYNFEGGGSNSYYKLSQHYDLPDPTKKSQESELFDPNAWINSEGSKFTGQMAAGEKFKVNSNPYEVKGQLGHQTQIIDLMTGKVGTINTDYQTSTLEPKEDYVPSESEDAGPKLEPAKGMTFAYGGEKHTITKVLKDGTVKAKPSGGKVVAVGKDDEALEAVYDPSAHKIGPQVKAGDLDVGDVFHGGKGQTQRPYQVTGKEGSTVLWKNLDTGEVGQSKASKTVRKMLDQEEGEPQTKQSGPDKPETLEPGTKYAVKNIPVGHVFTGAYGDEKFKVIHVPGSPEEQVAAGKIGPNGTFTGDITHLPPDEAVQYAGDQSYKPTPEAPAISGDGLADHMAEGGFEPYGSPYGSGGKYKHDKLGTMNVGTIFKGKEGKLWKVKSNDGDLVVTDGQQLYKADPTVRGRAVTADFVDSTGPLPGPGNDPEEASAGIKLAPNTQGLMLMDMPIGSTVAYGDKTFTVKSQALNEHDIGGGYVHLEGVGGTISQSAEATTIPDKIAEAEAPSEDELGSGLKPNTAGSPLGSMTLGTLVQIHGEQWIVGNQGGDLVYLHPRGGGQVLPFGVSVKPDAIGPIQSDAAWKDQGTTLADLNAGDVFTANNGDKLEVVTHGLDSSYVKPAGDTVGKVLPMPSTATVKKEPAPQAKIGKTVPAEAVTKAPAAELNFTKATPPPGDKMISDLEPGTKFTTMTGTNEVVAHTVDGKTVIKTDKGELGSWDSNSVLKADQLEASSSPAAAPTANTWSPPVEKALTQAHKTMDDVDDHDLNGYGSKWGSGGKYIHYRLSELEPGAVVKDKVGTMLNVLGSGPDGKTLIFLHGTNKLALVDSKTRLRRVAA